MNEIVAQELEILWADYKRYDDYEINEKLEAFKRLKNNATKSDLPQLVEALESENNDFWIRELLASSIAALGGSEYLMELFDALQKNFNDGYDNDLFLHCLAEIAETEPALCRDKLHSLLETEGFKHKKRAEWLLEFCQYYSQK